MSCCFGPETLLECMDVELAIIISGIVEEIEELPLNMIIIQPKRIVRWTNQSLQ